QAGLFHPTHHQVASLAIQFGERKPTVPSLGGGADLCQLHQRLPQTLAIDGDSGNFSHVDSFVYKLGALRRARIIQLSDRAAVRPRPRLSPPPCSPLPVRLLSPSAAR